MFIKTGQHSDVSESEISNVATLDPNIATCLRSAQDRFANVTKLRSKVVTLQRAAFSSFPQCRDVTERINSYFW